MTYLEVRDQTARRHENRQKKNRLKNRGPGYKLQIEREKVTKNGNASAILTDNCRPFFIIDHTP